MAAWIPKAVARTAKYQNAYNGICTVQSHDYSSKPRIIKNPTTASLKRGTGGRSSFSGMVCTVFGCSGFVGRYVCNRFGKIGTQLILPHRCDADRVKHLKLCGDLGQVFYQPFDLRDEESIIRSMKYSNVVVNLIGTNIETTNFSFHDTNVKGARTIARLAKQCNVERLIHVSNLNAEEDPKPILLGHGSTILRTKWEGECAVREEFPEATIIRPAVIYGQEDDFISHYMNAMRRNLKTVPLWEKGEKVEKQPVSVYDVAAGIVAAAKDPESIGKTYQFVGPHRYQLGELVQWLLDVASRGIRKYYAVIDMKNNPAFLMKVQLNELLYPFFNVLPFNWEVLELHHTTDKVRPDLPTLEDLGITPCELESRIHWELRTHKFDRYVIPTLEDIVIPTPKTIPLKKDIR